MLLLCGRLALWLPTQAGILDLRVHGSWFMVYGSWFMGSRFMGSRYEFSIINYEHTVPAVTVFVPVRVYPVKILFVNCIKLQFKLIPHLKARGLHFLPLR
jgi:hypothetical protein